MEIQVKNKIRSQLGRTYRQLQSTIKSEVSLITYVSILQLLRSSSIKQSDSVKVRHATKLSILQHSPNTDVYFLEADKIVVNLSNVKLSDTEVSVLSRGLNFSTPSQHLDCLDVRTSFECFYRQFYNNVPNCCISRLKQRLKGLCYNYIYGYRPNQFYNLSKEEFQSLQDLKKRKDIVFCKPDKGQGVVVLNRQDYANKLLNILNDKDKFKLLKEDPTERRESSLQRYLRYLKNLGAITEDTLNKVRPCGSSPSRIYGLPKLHKSDIPLRSIVSGIGSYTHKLAKYLSDILKPLANNEHTLKDSFEFTHQILGLDNVPFMCSFDIVSLFTCIPVKETIELEKVF